MADWPRLTLRLEVGLPLPEAPLARLQAQLVEGLTDLLVSLGIPARPDVQIIAGETFLAITVNEQPCLYPQELLWRVYSFVSGAVYQSVERLQLARWLAAALAEGQDLEQAVTFVRAVVTGALQRQPRLLLND